MNTKAIVMGVAAVTAGCALGALQPILAQGAEACAKQEAEQAVAEARMERARRCAMGKVWGCGGVLPGAE